MQKSNPFHRARAMMALVAAALALPPLAQREALAEIGPYKSRGHGRSVQGKVYRINPRKFTPNGAREVARRQRQIAKGMLSPVYPA